MASILTTLLQIFTDLTPDILDIYEELFGLSCNVYLPQELDDLFDDFGKVKYKSTPDYTNRQILIVNFIKPDAMRGNLTQFETFLGDDRPYIITHEKKRIPPRARIDAFLGGAKMSFQTEIDRVITGALETDPNTNAIIGDHSTILIKQYLRPLT